MLGFEIAIILFLIILSALFSGSETAITSISVMRAKKMLDENNRKNRLLELWIEHPNQILTTLLIGNNLVNILASSIATDVSYNLLNKFSSKIGHIEGLAIAATVGVMTFLILVFGELVPKTYAKHNVLKFLVFSNVILFFYWIFRLSSILLLKITSPIVKLLGGKTQTDQPLVTEEDIEFLIKQSTESGNIDSEKEQLLSSVIDFSDILVKEIMIPRTEVVAFDIDNSIHDLFELIKTSKFSRYPVYKETIDNIIGIFYVKDLIINYRTGERLMEDISSLLHKPTYVPETKKISEQLTEFQKNKIHIAVVLDEYGGTAGIVTLEDILEEIVGEIYDEFDISEERIIEIAPNKYLIKATTSIDEVADFFNVEFPKDEDYETIGGLIIKQMGRIPEKNTQLPIYKGIKIVVRDRDEKRIKTLEIHKLQS